MKYLLFKSPILGFYPILFPDFFSHEAVATMFASTPVSGGFITPQGEVYGEVIGLGIKANPERDKMFICWSYEETKRRTDEDRRQCVDTSSNCGDNRNEG